VRGTENPITTAPENATSSYVPTMGFFKDLKITSITVSNIRKVRLMPATILKKRLRPLILFRNPFMNNSSYNKKIKKGKGYSPLPLSLFYF
jgi:hypothetical protein